MSRQQTSEAVMKAVFPAFDGFALTASHSGQSEDIDTKRLLDVALAGILVVLLSPILALVSLAIMLDSAGPLVFCQMRTGLNGKKFGILKFRSMHVMEDGADFVVIDCGPVGQGSNAPVIARLADATVLVSKRQALQSPLIAKAAQVLESAKAAPLGIVITK